MVILGKDGNEYKSVKACMEADKAYDAAVAAREAEKQEKEKSVSARKRELANAIEKAEEARLEAIQKYEAVKQKAEEIIAEAQEKAEKMLREEARLVKKASEAKAQAILDFNKEFGAYRIILTGNDALREVNQIVKNINDRLFNRFWF